MKKLIKELHFVTGNSVIEENLRGKELGEGIYQQTNGTYCAKFVDRFGKRKSKRSKKLQGVRQWLADATYINEHSDIE